MVAVPPADVEIAPLSINVWAACPARIVTLPLPVETVPLIERLPTIVWRVTSPLPVVAEYTVRGLDVALAMLMPPVVVSAESPLASTLLPPSIPVPATRVTLLPVALIAAAALMLPPAWTDTLPPEAVTAPLTVTLPLDVRAMLVPVPLSEAIGPEIVRSRAVPAVVIVRLAPLVVRLPEPIVRALVLTNVTSLARSPVR